MKAHVYVDGFNLYFGCLKHSKYKWLDIVSLFANHIIKEKSPESDITKVKFFTADIKPNIAAHGKDALKAQHDYQRALETLYPELIEIIKGYHTLQSAKLPKYQKPLDKTKREMVWRLEEKQTDVNMALHLYRDLIRNSCQQVVLVSNDNDLAPALSMVREDFGDKVEIGIVTPRQKDSKRRISGKLSEYADWTRKHILDVELEKSQLPETIKTKKYTIKRPYYW